MGSIILTQNRFIVLANIYLLSGSKMKESKETIFYNLMLFHTINIVHPMKHTYHIAWEFAYLFIFCLRKYDYLTVGICF